MWRSGARAKVQLVLFALLIVGVGVGLVALANPSMGSSSRPGRTDADVGLRSVWTGGFSQAEDSVLTSALKSVKITAYNADTLIQNMAPEFEQFFDRSGTSMSFLLADPNDAYYIQNTVLTLRRPLTAKEIGEYQAHFHDAISRLKSLERDKGQQVEVRFFKNEMRLPIIPERRVWPAGTDEAAIPSRNESTRSGW